MKALRQVILGVVAALISLALVIGGLSLAISEGRMRVASVYTPTRTRQPTHAPLTVTPTPTIATPLPGHPTYTPQPTFTPSPSPTHTATLVPPTNCPPPAGWSPIIVQPGDTLPSLAQVYNTTTEALMRANCLASGDLIQGTVLYVPGLPPTQPPTPCGPPAGWVFYTVQPGDNLFRIGLAFGVSVYQLQLANCMGTSTLIRVGQRLYVPNVPTRTPTATATLVPTRPPTSTSTPTPTQTGTPTSPLPDTVTPTPTETPTPTPTETVPSLPSPTPTETVPSSPTPTLPVTLTPTPTATSTSAVYP